MELDDLMMVECLPSINYFKVNDVKEERLSAPEGKLVGVYDKENIDILVYDVMKEMEKYKELI